MASASVDFPSFSLAKTPELHETVVAGGYDMGSGGVEGDPVDATIVTLEHKLDDRVSVTKHVRLLRVGSSDLVLKGHGGGRGVFLPQTGDIPNTNGLVEGGGHD